MRNLKTKFITFSILVSCSIYLIGCSCAYKTITCPNTGNPVLYPKSQKCLKNFYQDAVKTYSPALKGTIDILNTVKIASLDAGVQTKTELLKQSLTSEDQLIQGVLQSATLMLQQRPCDGDVAYKKALDDAANYKIRLETIKADFQKNRDNQSGIENVLDEYNLGKTDGRNVGIVLGALDRYYLSNNRYPQKLSELSNTNAIKALAILGLSISYNQDTSESFSLRFAGKDGILNTADDKLHKGLKGKPIVN